MQALLRFLDLVRRELGADDVRGEIGGREPEGALCATLPGGIRVVVVFDAPPRDLEAAQVKLRALVESFASLGAMDDTLHPPMPRRGGHELEEALAVLAERARALAALVVDDSSPVIWGSSLLAQGPEDVEEAQWIAGVYRQLAERDIDLAQLVTKDSDAIAAALERSPGSSEGASMLAREVERIRELGARAIDPAYLRISQAVAGVRKAEGGAAPYAEPQLLVRPFASIYRLLLVFEGPFSELHAEGALIHALPVIEKLVTSLPPRDPAAGGAKVAVLRRLRPV